MHGKLVSVGRSGSWFVGRLVGQGLCRISPPRFNCCIYIWGGTDEYWYWFVRYQAPAFLEVPGRGRNDIEIVFS